MAITEIQNPYKLSPMKSFSYQPQEKKQDNNLIGAVSKGIGVVAPPAPTKMLETPTKQDTLELTQQKAKEMNARIEKGRKVDYAQRDLETPLGVKILGGIAVTAAAVYGLKKAGILAKVGSLFKKTV